MNKEIIKIPSLKKSEYSIDFTRATSSAYYPIVYMWYKDNIGVRAGHIKFCGDLAIYIYKKYSICNRLSKIILENDHV
jgi:hypothetical protein